MAFIREKEINGNRYLYLVKSIREGDRVRQKVIKYIGPKSEISEDEVDRISENTN